MLDGIEFLSIEKRSRGLGQNINVCLMSMVRNGQRSSPFIKINRRSNLERDRDIK